MVTSSRPVPADATATPPSVSAAAPPAVSAGAGRAVRLTRVLAVGSLLALIVLGLAWELRLAPTGGGLLALKVLPLALPLAGLMKYRLRSYRALSLGVWLYFTEGVVRAAGDRGLSAALAVAEVGLSLLLFVACALHVRTRLRAGRSAGADEAPA